MATIEKIKGGYKLIKGEFGRFNGYKHFCNDKGEWFYDEAMTLSINIEPNSDIDDADQRMLERFIRDNTLDKYFDFGFGKNILNAFAEALRQTNAKPGKMLYATRAGKITTSPLHNAKIGKMPEDFNNIFILWTSYIDRLVELV